MGCLANGSRVRQILSASSGEFTGDEIICGNEVRLETCRRIDHGFDSPLPRGIEIDPWNVGENVDAARLMPETEKVVSIFKVLGPDLAEGETKLRKGGIGSLSICRIGLNQEIEIFRRPGLGWKMTA